MDKEDDIIKSLMEDHKDDVINDVESAQESADNQGDNSGGDNSENKPDNAANGADDSHNDDEAESDDSKDGDDENKSGEDKDKPTELNDSQDAEAEPVGEKKDANSRIRQILEEKKELERKLAEKEAAERKAKDELEDPVYKLEDFIGTVDETGEELTDREAKARFMAWEANYQLRQHQKAQVLKEQQSTLIELQRSTKEAFEKFPEFDINSDKYDKELAEIANEQFRVGLIYADGHDGDDNYIVGSKINPSQLLERLHKVRTPVVTTKVNNLPSEDTKLVSTKQVTKTTNKYAPGFRGEVDKAIDELRKKES